MTSRLKLSTSAAGAKILTGKNNSHSGVQPMDVHALSKGGPGKGRGSETEIRTLERLSVWQGQEIWRQRKGQRNRKLQGSTWDPKSPLSTAFQPPYQQPHRVCATSCPGVQFCSSSLRVPGQLYADDLELFAECEFDLRSLWTLLQDGVGNGASRVASGQASLQ